MPKPTITMSPGTYVRKRREAFGLSLRETAAAFAMFSAKPELPVVALFDDRVALLTAAENDQDNLTLAQVAQLRFVFPLDLHVYEALLYHYAGAGHRIPAPAICPACAANIPGDCCCDVEIVGGQLNEGQAA